MELERTRILLIREDLEGEYDTYYARNDVIYCLQALWGRSRESLTESWTGKSALLKVYIQSPGHRLTIYNRLPADAHPDETRTPK